MTVDYARDHIRLYLGRIVSSVLHAPSIGAYLCDTDLQDIAIYNLAQAGEVLEECPQVTESLALSPEDAEWIRTFYHMTCTEKEDINHAQLWHRMSAVLPLVA